MRGRTFSRPLALGAGVLATLFLTMGPADAETIRGHSTRGGHPGAHNIHLHGGFGFYASYYYLPHYYPYGYYPPYAGYYGPTYLPDVAYLDTDIQPEKAEVYLDGEYVGIADNYDGFPRYLSVTPGRHTVTFKDDGYRAVTRSVRVPRGVVLQLDFTLPKGTGAEPPAGGKEDDEEIAVPEYTRPGNDPDTDAVRGEEGEAGDDDEAMQSEPGFVRLNVTPPDASIYIDGKLAGSASSMASLHGQLRLESGSHRLEAVRPGYRPVRREVEIRPGDHLTLSMDLQREAPRQNSPR